MRFKTCRRYQKININLENCAFHCFVLYNYIRMYGAKNIKKSSKTVCQNFVSEGIFLSVFIKELQRGLCRHKYPGIMKLTVTTCKFANTPKNA